jgi:hypothetical protein
MKNEQNASWLNSTFISCFVSNNYYTTGGKPVIFVTQTDKSQTSNSVHNMAYMATIKNMVMCKILRG